MDGQEDKVGNPTIDKKSCSAVTYTSEDWQNAANHLAVAMVPLGQMLRSINHEGLGEQDEREFLDEMAMAVMAMRFIACHDIEITALTTDPKPENPDIIL